MTNELEKQFFQCFGIEPKCQNKFINPSKCPFIESRECCDCVSFEHPQITDTHYLKLICILNKFDTEFIYFYQEDIRVLKETILEDCLEMVCKLRQETFENFKHQVRTLFKEG